MNSAAFLSSVAGLSAAAVLGWSSVSGAARAAGPQATETHFAPSEFGGVTRVLRYDVAQPDRSETAFLFLGPPGALGAPPEQVQVVGKGGEAVQLSDVQGADCTLERVWIRTAGRGGPEVVHAVRTFSGNLATDVASEPAAMEVSVFRPVRGGEPGDSAVILRLVGAPVRTRPICSAADVRREMARVAAGMRAGR